MILSILLYLCFCSEWILPKMQRNERVLGVLGEGVGVSAPDVGAE